jgi:pyridoxamine 5'-phosphate oxidase
VSRRFGIRDASDTSASVPRPAHWGGYRLWAEAVELWVEGDARVHDRARWTRTLTPKGDSEFECSPWSATRLQP